MHICLLRPGRSAAYTVDQCHRISRWLVAPPSNMLIRTREQQFAWIECRGLGRIDVDDRHRYATMGRRPDESADLDPRIKTKQREVRAQHVVERPSIPQPQMRGTASRHR